MKKLTLDDLQVTSFSTEKKATEIRGTVQGHEYTLGSECSQAPACNTYDQTCYRTCGPVESCEIFC